jgi:tetratricopeptide (TPR) repeat protein
MRSLRHCLRLLLPAALALASSASAQSVERAKQLFDDAKFADAKSELLAVQKANDRNAAAAYYLGRIATIDNDADDAIIRLFERAVQLDDGNALYHLWLGSAVGDATQRASKLKAPFMARRVKKEWERAVELDPNLVDARTHLVGFYSQAPGFMGGSMDRAREQAVEIAKRNAMRGAMARGEIAEREKNTPAEEAAYQQAIAAAPDSAEGYVALADVYVRTGKASEAFATLDRYVKRSPNDRFAPYYVGRVAGASGEQLERGESALKQFLAAPPSDAYAPTIAGAHYRLGQIAEKRGAKDAAREHYLAAMKVNPKGQLAKRALEALR